MKDSEVFEQEVQRIAAQLYPEDPYGGPSIRDGRERDGIFETEQLIVAIEATTLRTKAKAEQDGRKLKALVDDLAKKNKFKAIQGIFITQSEPTADQMDVIRKIGQPITAMSFARFKSKLIDSRLYLQVRDAMAFGSARDPETDDTEVSGDYIPLSFVDTDDRTRTVPHTDLPDLLAAAETCVLIGDFGTGKSMTLRQVYREFRKHHLTDSTQKFCIHLNLNEHQGQADTSEALIRHANRIGFDRPAQLVRAWRSGEAHIILDGFDEIFLTGWISGARPIRDIRRNTVALVRRFCAEKPRSSGLLIAGREHYFDSTAELREALGVPAAARVLTASDFTENQVTEFLRSRDWMIELPDWLPRRPLMIGYFAGRQLLSLLEGVGKADAGVGWDFLLEQISLREARVEAGIDSHSVRRLIERLATYSRATPNGLGPLTFADMVDVFRDLFNYLPDEGAYSVLQRLPGLRATGGESNDRFFVDDDFVDAARSGDVRTWIENPYDDTTLKSFHRAQNLLGNVGLAVLQHQIDDQAIAPGLINVALDRLAYIPDQEVLRADLARLSMSYDVGFSKVYSFSDLHIPIISIGHESKCSGVSFTSCIIDVLDISDVDSIDALPTFRNCSIGLVRGIAGIDELGTEKFAECEVTSFEDSTENMNSILQLNVSDDRRVALIILRKIFVQSGHSRKESALYRGSLTAKQRELVPRQLESLAAHGAIRKSRRKDTTLWAPNLALLPRVRRILDMPATSNDELVAGL